MGLTSSTIRSASVPTAEITAAVDKAIASNQVMIFSKTYCPYCSETKTLFQRIGSSSSTTTSAQVNIMELDRVTNGSAIQQALLEKTGQRTVPNVFINGNHLGGNDDTQAAFYDGTLQSMLSSSSSSSKK